MIDYEKIKKLRRRNISFERNIQNKEEQTIGNYIIINHNSWQGLKTASGIMLIEPIYDTIDIVLNSACCILKLQDAYFLYELYQGKMIDVELPLIKYKINELNSTIEIETAEGKGLYSCERHKMVVPARFAEVTKSAAIRYLWVRTHDDRLAFYDSLENRLIKCPEDATLCLECNDDIMWVKVGRNVHAINDSGIFDKSIIRKCALKKTGRMRFYNHNYNETVITDIYGHIIN